MVKIISSLTIATYLMMISSCATLFVRTDSSDKPEHVYPATAFDAQFIWEAGIRGEPLIVAMNNPEKKNAFPIRIIYTLGGIIDLPTSLIIDTVFLPLDVVRLSAQKKSGEQVNAANPTSR